MDKAIIVDHLFKNISFTIQTGEIVGLVGPKGSGKTSLIKILTGLKKPDLGYVSVLGFNPWEKSYDFLKQIALILDQNSQLNYDLPAIKTFELNKKIYKISDRNYNKNLDEAMSLMGIPELLMIPVRELSEEQRIKMDFIATLIYKPKVLFIDEAKIDLDFLYEYNKRNETTILITSNNLKNLAGFTRRVIAIDNGKLIFDGPLEKLR